MEKEIKKDMEKHIEKSMEKTSEKYQDMLLLPHHVSSRHPAMSMTERAAQFSPFAALTGFGEAVEEEARLTEERVELDEYEKEKINAALQELQARLAAGRQAEAAITWFRPDARKAGGVYVTTAGAVKKLDLYRRQVVMQDGTKIPVRDIIEVINTK